MKISKILEKPNELEKWCVAGIGLLGTVSFGLLITTIVLQSRDDNHDKEKRKTIHRVETASAIFVALFLIACIITGIRFYRKDCFDTPVSFQSTLGDV